MARNIEIKAHARRFDHQRDLAATLAGSQPQYLEQEDIFFHSNKGRLKLRIFSDTHGQLIFYKRTDKKGPKASRYHISETDEPRQLCRVLSAAYAQCGTVRKKRTVFLVGETRIHLDEVAQLGQFIELEVVLSKDQTEHEGTTIVEKHMQALDIDKDDLIDRAYFDLLDTRRGQETRKVK